MAKYVGKIFRVSNKALKIKGKGTHYVHVKWYNPFTRKFRCNVITSLEDKRDLPKEKRHNLHVMTFHKEDERTYHLFSRDKYEDLRNGQIVPIPVHKSKGFKVWSGYKETRDLTAKALKGNEQKHLHIEK